MQCNICLSDKCKGIEKCKTCSFCSGDSCIAKYFNTNKISKCPQCKKEDQYKNVIYIGKYITLTQFSKNPELYAKKIEKFINKELEKLGSGVVFEARITNTQ